MLRHVTLLALLTLPFAAAAEQPSTQIALATSEGKSYDATANCLMRHISSNQYKAWPSVSVPPRKDALVNVWFRGRDFELPIATFHVQELGNGTTTVKFTETKPSPLEALARKAAETCAK